jgi:hypothetical protein
MKCVKIKTVQEDRTGERMQGGFFVSALLKDVQASYVYKL